MKKKHTKLNITEVSRAYALLTTLAINLIVIIVAMFFLGVFLDKLLGTSPICLFICILLGMGASFRNIYILSMKSMPMPEKPYEYKEEETKEDE